MAMMEINWNPSRKELRQFGFLCLLFFGLLGARNWHHNGVTLVTELLLGAAVVGGVLGAVAPQLLKWIFVGWIVAVFPIGWTISHLVLGITYFVLFTIFGLTLRLVRYDPLERRKPADRRSHWHPRRERRAAASYFKQF
jgi:hypothetical protein